VLGIPENVKNTARNNIDYLMAQTLVKAKQKLVEGKGEFYPFGAGLFGNGKVRYIWVDNGKDASKLPAAEVGLHAVRRTLQANANKEAIVASSVYYILSDVQEDGSLKKKMVVELEHLPGIALARAIQYSVNEDGTITYGGTGEQEFSPKVFVIDPELQKAEKK